MTRIKCISAPVSVSRVADEHITPMPKRHRIDLPLGAENNAPEVAFLISVFALLLMIFICAIFELCGAGKSICARG